MMMCIDKSGIYHHIRCVNHILRCFLSDSANDSVPDEHIHTVKQSVIPDTCNKMLNVLYE